MAVLPFSEWVTLLLLLAAVIVVAFVGRVTNARDDPRIQLTLGVTSLFFAVLVFVFANGDFVTWQSISLFVLGLSFLSGFRSLTRSSGVEDTG